MQGIINVHVVCNFTFYQEKKNTQILKDIDIGGK